MLLFNNWIWSVSTKVPYIQFCMDMFLEFENWAQNIWRAVSKNITLSRSMVFDDKRKNSINNVPAFVKHNWAKIEVAQ